MLRTLLACLLMLLAVPAAAQVSTSKTVSITVTAPAGVCSVPPAAPAMAAGFTTPVLCSDWTVQMPPNWLGGCSVAGNGSQTNPNDNTGHNWYLNIWWSNTNQNCNTVQHTDPTFGGLALDMPWVSNSANQQIGTTLQTAAWFSTDTGDANQGISVPNNFYMETVARQTPIAQGSFFAFWTWPLLAMTQGSTGQAGNELDSVELDSGNLNNSDSAYHNWLLNNFGPWVWQGICGQGAVPQGLPCGFDPTQYHTFSSLMTSDGVNNQVCSYVDGALINCQPSPGGFTPVQAVARYFILLQNACDWWNYPSNFCNAGLNQHTYVKSVKLWSCPTWQTTQCNKTGVGGGAPNGTNQFSGTWTNSAGTQAVTAAPDGTTTALKITQDSSVGGNHGVIQTGAFPTTAPSTFGLNIAPGAGTGASSIQLVVCEGPTIATCTDYVGAFFNPTTGQLIKTSTANANDHFLGSGATPIAGGGFHVWFTYSMPASPTVIALIAAGAQQNGDGVSSNTVWNWAIETGANAPTDGIGPGLFVATNGNDSNPGTQASPFLTFAKCQTAMRAGSTKTCYVRSGTYHLASIGDPCGIGGSSQGIGLVSADAGETLSVFPPDGFNSAVLDGGSTGPGVGLDAGICVASGIATPVTINGLKLQHFMFAAIYANSPLVATNNEFTQYSWTQTTSISGAAIRIQPQTSTSVGYTIQHNYCHDSWADCVVLIGNGAANAITNSIVSNNAAINVCANPSTSSSTVPGDCGAFYTAQPGTGSSSNVRIINNFVRDVYVAGGGNWNSDGGNAGIGIYLDDCAVNTTVTGNVLTGLMGTGFFVHGGSGHTIKNNIYDESTANPYILIAQSQTGPNCGGSGGNFTNNIIVANNNGAGGLFGYVYRDIGQVMNSITNNQYFNYSGNGSNTSGGGGMPNDSNPVLGNPLIHCNGAILSTSSPALNSPVSFPSQPSGYDTPGYWGPPGFTIPHTGTTPSWPTASGDGVTCTNSN